MASIQTNLGANSALLNVGMSGMNLNKEITRLSSGFRINSAGDDAAGLAIANKLRGEGASLAQAGRNASQASSMLQIADGATNTVSTILDRLKELATEANSASIGTQAPKLTAEFAQLTAEIDRIAATTKYQGSALVNGTFGATVDTASGSGHSTVLAVTGVTGATASGAPAGTYTLTSGSAGHLTMTSGGISQTLTDVAGAQTLNFSALGITLTTGTGYVADSGVGNVVVAGNSASFMVSSSGSYGTNDLITLNAVDLTVAGLGLTGLDLNSATNAQTALTAIDGAVDKTNTAIGTIGAAESRINFASTNVATIGQNVTAAESTIRDADMAAETTQFTKYNILQQAGMAMISQANQSASEVLTLLR
ncbi:MAG TPA: flagellin [Gemmatimonadales bacterium]